ncbi:hypothetical protein [Nibrella saemangeumensis]
MKIQSVCEHPNYFGTMISQHKTLRDDFMNPATAGMLTGNTGVEKDPTMTNPRMAADYDDTGTGAGRGYGGVDDDENLDDEELEDLTIDDEDDLDEDDDFDDDDEDLDDDVEDDMDDDSTLRGRW